ncbi:ABC transporter ATP-binding protein [Chitinophaga pollutisoli]|uniref:ABC transporter ATP-binding protein n=1 Tax=Chitinophaga pollutisoli TaxID=3133966 RepID=A0ABZ2YM29_9BACT
MGDIILEARNINKYFHDPVEVKALDDICLSVRKGEFATITGKSGCGKSTLLYILSTMDTDYEGELLIDGEPMNGKSEATLAGIRNGKIGFVFQFHYLLNEFSVLQNVMLPGLKLNRFPPGEVENRAMARLDQLGIRLLAKRKAYQLSGGEKQRVAIARALINDPCIIMGDEPTGNLDKKNGELVFNIFRDLAADYLQTLLIVTHDETFASRTDRTIRMEDGKIMDGQL